jgi:hypothetical protein
MAQLRYIPGERAPEYPLDRRLGVRQSWSGDRGQTKNPLLSQGMNPGSSVKYNTIPIELHQLHLRYVENVNYTQSF